MDSQICFLEIYAQHYELYKADPIYKLPDSMTLLNEIRSNRDYPKVVNAAKNTVQVNNVSSKNNKKKDE